MTLRDFCQSLTAAEPPAKLTLALAGLWWDGKGDQSKCSELVAEYDKPGYYGRKNSIRFVWPSASGPKCRYKKNHSLGNDRDSPKPAQLGLSVLNCQSPQTSMYHC
jgi:hypothetical protein